MHDHGFVFLNLEKSCFLLDEWHPHVPINSVDGQRVIPAIQSAADDIPPIVHFTSFAFADGDATAPQVMLATPNPFHREHVKIIRLYDPYQTIDRRIIHSAFNHLHAEHGCPVHTRHILLDEAGQPILCHIQAIRIG